MAIDVGMSTEQAEEFATTWRASRKILDSFTVPSSDGRNIDLHVLADSIDSVIYLNGEASDEIDGLNMELENPDDGNCVKNTSRPGLTILLKVYRPDQKAIFEAFRPTDGTSKKTG